jgi:uncharacterized RDD family membrane protein YckC
MPNSWYYASGNRQVGPISEGELDALVDSGAVNAGTLVWHQGLSNWIPYASARPERPAGASDTAVAESVQATRYCTECGRPSPERELARFGDRLVCANCKPAFAHQLRERGLARGSYAYAGFWVRFVAKLIDSMIMYIVILPVTFLVLGMGAFDPRPEDFGAGFLAAQIGLMIFNIVFVAAYETWFLANYSATPGKMALGKKVIVADGSRLTYGRALARHLSTYISSFTLGIGYIMAAFDDEKRALHDRICDTRVVAK